MDRIATRAGIRLLDGDHVHYCVHSAQQKERFPELWGVAADRVHVAPYYYTLSEEELAEPVDRSGGVFAGGDSHRDYGPLIEAAREIDSDFTLATGRLSADQLAALPPNVRAGRVPHDEFMRRFRSAAVVVVALQGRSDRSAGEQTYLNAMVLGKPVIVVDTMGVREYVEDGKTGLIVPPKRRGCADRRAALGDGSRQRGRGRRDDRTRPRDRPQPLRPRQLRRRPTACSTVLDQSRSTFARKRRDSGAARQGRRETLYRSVQGRPRTPHGGSGGRR